MTTNRPDDLDTQLTIPAGNEAAKERLNDDGAANLIRYFDRQVGRCADAMRHAADAVERDAGKVRPRTGEPIPDYPAAARDLVRAVQRLTDQVPLSNLLEAATDIDRYVRGGLDA